MNQITLNQLTDEQKDSYIKKLRLITKPAERPYAKKRDPKIKRRSSITIDPSNYSKRGLTKVLFKIYCGK